VELYKVLEKSDVMLNGLVNHDYEGKYLLFAKLNGIDGFATTRTVLLSTVKNDSTTKIIPYINGKRTRVKIVRSELPLLKEGWSFLNGIAMSIIMGGVDE
jgi:hypothetical protein